jgi:Kef-type K+ transport system membrane component KefB
VTAAELQTLVLVVSIAALSPFLSDLSRRWTHLPGVVVEIVLGIMIGPHVLDWVELDEVITVMAEMGLVFLIFLAGFEIDMQRVKGSPLRLAVTHWVCSLVIGVVVASLLHFGGVTVGIRFVAIALTTTAIGTLLPILGDAGILPTRFGSFVLAGGAMGELGPILAISIALTSDNPGRTTLILAAFAAVAFVAGALASRPAPPHAIRLITATLHSSAQLGVRLSVLLCVLLVWIANRFDLDVLLGAFAAGMIARVFLVSQSVEPTDERPTIDHHHEIQTRLESLGFGFFIPLFFVISGAKFDLAALGEWGTLAKVPMFLVLFVVVRGLPALLYRRELHRHSMRALGLLMSAGLPLIVVITSLGVEEGQMRSDNAAAMVGAGLVSVVLFPIIGLALHGRAPEQPEPATVSPRAARRLRRASPELSPDPTGPAPR